MAPSSVGRNPIDHFVAARLEAVDLMPSLGTDRTPLVRRESLDLTCMPPTPAHVRPFCPIPNRVPTGGLWTGS